MSFSALFISFVFLSMPWVFAFVMLSIQPSGQAIFMKSIVKWMLFAVTTFLLLYVLAIRNDIPLENKTGSYSAGEIREAVYFFIACLLVPISYLGSGIHCYAEAKKRYLTFYPSKKKLEAKKNG